MNYQEFISYIDTLAADYDESQYDYFGDYCHECADGSEHVIYYGKAWELVNMIRLSDYSRIESAELAIEHELRKDINGIMSQLAYELIYQELSAAIQEIRENKLSAMELHDYDY